MLKMARPRKSTASHKLHGTFQKCRHESRIDHLAKGEPKMASDLCDIGKEVWESTIENAIPGQFSALDSPVLNGMCRWYAKYLTYTKKAETGEEDWYKAEMVAAMSWKQYLAAVTRLGIPVVDRARLELPRQTEKKTGVPSRNRA